MNNTISNSLTGVYITLASPNQILIWSSRKILNTLFIGEVSIPETINYKTGIPKENGLFCEKIFGPTIDWGCDCILIHSDKFKEGYICKNCGKELNSILLRRYRMGHIKLNYPILHPWFYKKNFSIFSLLLNVTTETLLSLIYYKYINFINGNINYLLKFKNIKNLIILNIFNIKNLQIEQLLNINLYIQKYFKEFNYINNMYYIREFLFNKNISCNNFDNIIKILNLLNLFYINKINLSWLIMDIIPVIPPELRPFSKLSKNYFIISKLNKSYINIIIYNNKLKKYIKNKIQNITNFEILDKIQLQKSSEILFENYNKSNNNISLSYSLLGKYGRFRQDLLGKRIDFSSRSVIISGVDLNFFRIGVPINIGISLFKPILLSLLYKNKTLKTIITIANINFYCILLRRILTRIFKYYMVLLNRAPTLHRMNIQSFKPYLIEGYSIKLYPLACSGFNADFDGDQMSMLLLITKSSRLEAKYILAADKNIFSPATGNLIYKLNQGMILGLYNIIYIKNILNYYFYFKYKEDVLDALNQNLLYLNNIIWIKYLFYINFKIYIYFIITTGGRVLLNNNLNILY